MNLFTTEPPDQPAAPPAPAARTKASKPPLPAPTAPPEAAEPRILALAYQRIAALSPRPRVRHDAPSTSHAAADAAAEDGSHGKWMLTFAALIAYSVNGLTDDEIKAKLEKRGDQFGASTVSATMAKMRHEGIVIAGPDERPTRLGRGAKVNRLAGETP